MADRSTLGRQFYGRKRIVQEIVSGLGAPQPVSYCVVGSNLIGKTRLLQYLASADGPLRQRFAECDQIIVAHLDGSGRDAQEDLERAIAGRLLAALGAADEQDSAANGHASAPLLSDTLQMAADIEIRPVLLLDNFDKLVEERSDAAKSSDALVPLMQEMPVVVTASQPLYDLPGQPAPFSMVDALTQRFLGLIESQVGLGWTQAFAESFPLLVAVAPMLAEYTGMHPFLLDQLGYTLAGVQELLTSGQTLGSEHLPLIRMRLAENGRPLFVALWRGLQSASPRDDLRTRMALLERLVDAPLPAQEATSEQSPSLNLLINQAVVVYGRNGYQFACPLFAEFVSRRIGTRATYRARGSTTSNTGSTFANSLTKTENALLQYFQAHRNEVLSHQELLNDVWNRPDASPRRVQEAIRRLRLRLEEAVPPVGAIENERGRGYRFVPANR